MAMTGVDGIFVDTNVLVFVQQSHSPFHSAATAKLMDLAIQGHPLWISRQVLREYLVSMSRPSALTSPVPMTQLIEDIERFRSQFLIAEDGVLATDWLATILQSTACLGKQIHDANIVATMLANGIKHLLTHNVADFQRFSANVTVIPMT